MSEEFIGKYQVVRTIGKGSMGLVYLAQDPEIGRIVAIKTLKSVYLGDDATGNEAMQRFKQESRSAGQLQHPNIVTIFEAGRADDGSPFIVMEFIEGTPLDNLIEGEKPIPPAEVLHYMSQIGCAIDYAHTKDVIHRDIKPSNVLIGEDFKPFLLDFGVAKLSDTSLTPAGTVVGTPSYMSPEQIRGEKLDGRTDVFSLAVLTFEAIAGKRPFPGKDFTTVVSNIIHKEPLTFAELGVELPHGFEQVLGKGMAKDRGERFKNCLEFIDAAAKEIDIVVDGSGLVGGYDSSSEELIAKKIKELCKSNGNNVSNKPTLEEVPAPENTKVKPPDKNKGGRIAFLGGGTLAILLVVGFILFRGGDAIVGTSGPSEIVTSSEKISEPITKPVAAKSPVATPTVTSSLPAPEEEKVAEEVKEEIKFTASNYSTATIGNLDTDELAILLTLEDVDDNLLKVAIKEAGKRADSQLIPALIPLTRHPRYAMQVAVLKVLSKEPYKDSVEVYDALVACLDDKEYIVRGFAAKIIGAIGREDSQAVLEKRLAVEDNEIVKKIINAILTK